MKLIEKIKNWIIRKLGGYTEKEFGYVCRNWMDRRVEVAELEEKYTAEHEAYLALLNCHNATAEAAQKQQNVTEMAKAIKAHCADRDDCEGCELCDAYMSSCKLGEIVCPCYWEVE